MRLHFRNRVFLRIEFTNPGFRLPDLAAQRGDPDTGFVECNLDALVNRVGRIGRPLESCGVRESGAFGIALRVQLLQLLLDGDDVRMAVGVHQEQRGSARLQLLDRCVRETTGTG